ncbi:MAG: O-antigen ligase family protein [Pseudomonadota bacterium]
MAAEFRFGGDVKAALAVAVVLTMLGMLIGDTGVSVGLALLIIPALFYAASKIPIRYSLMAMMFFAYILPNPQEGVSTGKWDMPLLQLGKVLLDHINTVDRTFGPLSVCSFSGLDLGFASLTVIALMRRSSGSKLDSAGRLSTPVPLVKMAWLSLASIVFVWFMGLATGGEFSMSLWQLNAVMYVPIVFLLCHVGLRGPSDFRALSKVLLTAAAYKSALAVFVAINIRGPMDPYIGSDRLPYATAHADSILFADACLLLIALLLERRKIKLMAALLLPVFMAGMIANNRRMVWVQIILALVTVFLVSRDNPTKRFIKRSLLIGAPIAAIYVAVGWNSGGGNTFKPVRMLRSVVDAKSDGSSYWRELENYNLITTMRHNLVFGTGLGHPYEQAVAMPAVDYTLERYVPHNSILGLWAYYGYVGYAGLTLLWAGGVYFAMRAYHGAKTGEARAGALFCFGAVVVWFMQCWGDLGLGVWVGIFTVAPSLAMAGKLAVATGEWTPKGTTKRVQAQAAASPQA